MVAARPPDPGSRHAPWTTETVFGMFPRLAERKHQIAAHLSGGEQQMLAIGRALMANPRVLLMDEPSEGLAPQIVADVMATIRKLKESGLSIVLVEQNPRLVFDIADDIVILNSGRVAVVSTAGRARARRRRSAPASRRVLRRALMNALHRGSISEAPASSSQRCFRRSYLTAMASSQSIDALNAGDSYFHPSSDG